MLEQQRKQKAISAFVAEIGSYSAKQFAAGLLWPYLLSGAIVILCLIGVIYQAYVVAAYRYLFTTLPYAYTKVWPHVLSAANEKALKAGDSFEECAQDCPLMIVVPSGSFMMGGGSKGDFRYYQTGSRPATISSHVEQPQHNVTFAKPFAVSKFELTFDDWDACVKGGGCGGYTPPDFYWGRGRQPVIMVNWDDAQRYVAWLSLVTGKTYRLLSEAEYEYAARAGTMTTYPWGDDVDENNANCDGCGSKWRDLPLPVGSFPPNKFGLYDMIGNVSVWTEDCGHGNYNGAPTDGSAWLEAGGGVCSLRAIRGGSWNSPPTFLRSAARAGEINAGLRISNLGVRLGRTLSGGEGAIRSERDASCN